MINISSVKISPQEKEAVLAVLDSGNIVQGEKAENLEKTFANNCGLSHAIVVNTGTAALHTALDAVGVKEGDEVITSAFTFVATANSVLMTGAKPVFADIDPQTFNLDPESVKQKINSKTKAILTVDLYGLPCNYDAFHKIAQKHDLLLVADSCQAVGASYNDQPVGFLADISAFSLYATKNIMSAEGGVITTDNDIYAANCRSFRNHGQMPGKRYHYQKLGYNYRLTDILAAIGLEQVKKLDEYTKARQNNAQKLTEKLGSLDKIETPYVPANTRHAFHQYTIKLRTGSEDRNSLQDFLAKNNIGAKVYYPKPLHVFDHLNFGKKISLPQTESVVEQALSLPVHPDLSNQNLDKIISAIKDWHDK